MARKDASSAVRIEGLSDLNRSLGRVDKQLQKATKAKLRGTAREVRDDARPGTPVKSGRLAKSLRYSVTNKGASVFSNLPYAPVQEFGGTISPRGTPINIKSHRMLGRSVTKNTALIEEEIGAIFDLIARRNGFR